VARALSYRPSYLAIGPIFPTTTKEMAHAPQGLSSLGRWRRSLSYPLVAIGGIFLGNAKDVLASGSESVAVVRAIADSTNPSTEAAKWMMLFEQEGKFQPNRRLYNTCSST
jgi:thiamine-phosphate diphosphorylase